MLGKSSSALDEIQHRLPPARLLNWCLWAIIFCLLLPLYLRIAWGDPIDYPRGGLGAADFKAYYIAARLMARNEDIYAASQQTLEMDALGLPRDGTLYIYPSAFAVALMPLTSLSLADAARVWNLINVVLLVVSLFLVTRALDLHRGLGLHYPWFIILFAIAAPTLQSLRIGQANILVLFLLALALNANCRGNLRVTGTALAVATLIKVFPGGLLAWCLWKRQYRVLVWAVGTAAFVLLANGVFLALTGRDWTLDVRYVTQVLTNVTVFTNVDNESLYGFLSRFDLAPTWLSALTDILSLTILTVAVYGLSRMRYREEAGLSWATVLMTLLLVTTITWWSTLVLLLIPFAILVQVWDTEGRPRPLALVLACSYLLLSSIRVLAMARVDLIYSPWLIAMPFYGTLLLWGTTLWKIWRLRPESDIAPTTR